MLFGQSQKADESIVLALLGKNALSADELHRTVADRARKYSLQAIYQELRKLARQGVIVKHGRRYSLHVGWLLQVIHALESRYESLLSEGDLTIIVPEPGKRLKFSFNSLERLVPFFSHVALTLAHASDDRRYFDWVPFIWYHFVDLSNEERYLRAVRKAKMRYYLVSGSDTKFDRAYASIAREGIEELYRGRKGLWGQPFPYANRFISVVGSFIIEIHFPKSCLTEVARLLKAPSGEADFAVMKKALLRQGSFALTVLHNQAKAKLLRKKFCEYLGVPLSVSI